MKILHTMIRVTDLQKSINFYVNAFNMKLFKLKEYPEGEFTIAFIGYDNQSSQIELTYNYGVTNYILGDAFGHIAIEVEDMNSVCEKAIIAGGKVTRSPGPMKFGTTIIAFIQDPDGYSIELIQK